MNVHGLLWLTVFLMVQSIELHGQSQDFDQKDFFSGFHFSVSGNSGFSKFGFEPPSTISLKSPLLTQNSANMEVQYYFNKGLCLSTSLGYLFATQKNYRKQGGDEWYHYRDGLAWLGYRNIDIGLGLSRFLTSKLLIKPSIKLGSLEGRFPRGLTRQQDGPRIEATKRVNPYVLAQVDLGFLLRKYNTIDVGFYYRHSFSDIYVGTYFDFPEPTAFSGSGSELGMSLGYSFTGYNRRLAKSKSKKDLLEYKMAFRHIGERDKLIEASVDLFSFTSFNDDPEGIITNSVSYSVGLRLEAEFGLSQHRFWELGWHLGQYFTGYTILNEDKSDKIAESQSGPDYQIAISSGYGIRFVTKQEIQIITLSAGIAINGTLTGSHGSFSSLDQDTNEYNYKFEFGDVDKTFIYPTAYVNLNKDFQLTNKMYVSVNYRYNQGFIKNVVRTYEGQSYGSPSRQFEGFRNGTSWTLGIGLKYNLGGETQEMNDEDDRRQKSKRSRRKK